VNFAGTDVLKVKINEKLLDCGYKLYLCHAGIFIMMKRSLMVAEKPSLAASLANILSNGRSITKKGIMFW
jgi:hypothetical protein